MIDEHDLELYSQIATNSGDIRDAMERLIDELRDTREQLRETSEENKRLEALGRPVEDSYARLAMRTAADTWHQPTVAQEDLIVEILFNMANEARLIDAYKASIFYGKPFTAPEHIWCRRGRFVNVNHKRIHAVLGIISEAGEIVENLLKEMAGDTSPAIVDNYVEETGDLDWFQELLATTIRVSTDDSRRANIAKLTKRYPNKFTSETAIARADKLHPDQDFPVGG